MSPPSWHAQLSGYERDAIGRMEAEFGRAAVEAFLGEPVRCRTCGRPLVRVAGDRQLVCPSPFCPGTARRGGRR